ncbi:MAG: TatD family hydrolase [Candidatus Helarchaeota archaeon]|nr:TatD family hydrolase [Candidatus Helarchaeota archaeon]
MKIIDAHIHTIFRPSKFFEEYRLMGVEAVITVAFYPITPTHTNTLEDLFRWLIKRETKRLQAAGIVCYCGIGIHPRSIPGKFDTKIYNFIKENMGGRVVALGEIGLEKATEEEIEVLEKQLIMAKEHNNFPVILHTPGKNKRDITKKLIELLESIGITNGIIDHVSPENIDLALNTKLYIGLTVQKGKLTMDSFLQIIREQEDQINRIILNSDLGIDIAHKFIVPKTIQRMAEEGIDEKIIQKISHKNAEKLFKIL